MCAATPFDQLACRIAFKLMRYNGLFAVPDTDKSLSFPGSLGGMNWSSMSFDPNNQYMFVNDMRLVLWVQMIPANTSKIARGSNGSEAINTGMCAVAAERHALCGQQKPLYVAAGHSMSGTVVRHAVGDRYEDA